MEIEDYIQNGEKVHCRTETKAAGGENRSEGTLVCTDTRLLFFRDRSVVDLNLRSIDEVEFYERYIPWAYIMLGIGSFLIGIVLWEFEGLIPISEIESIIGVYGLIIGVIMGVALLVDAYAQWKPTLFIRTSVESRKFIGGSLESFPHAIRGASQ